MPTSCKNHLADYRTILTCLRAFENHQQTPLLKLPPELLHEICDYVFNDQVLHITMDNGQLYLVHAPTDHLFGLPFTCRKLYQDTVAFPYTKTTFKMFTYKFISLLEAYRYPFLSYLDDFLDALDSIPVGVNIARFEIVGVMAGPDRFGPSDEDCKLLATRRVEGFDPTVDYKAELEKEILGLFPDAEVVFRTLDTINYLRKWERTHFPDSICRDCEYEHHGFTEEEYARWL